MSATRPRHHGITETAETAAAVDEAAIRLEALQRHAGALAGVYPAGHLEELREDWPE